MIPYDFITEWRSQVPWPQDVQVEQDLIISRALVEMYGQRSINNTLAFRGGTALYKLHISPPPRYSEDIDLVQVQPEPIGSVLDSIRTVLDPWLGVPKRKFKEGSVSLIYRTISEGQQAVPMKLKVEINTREHFTVLGFQDRSFSLKSRWFSGTTSIKTYCLNELLGTKLRALYQRKKGRDLFDLWVSRSHPEFDPDRLIECFLRYVEHEGGRISRNALEENLNEKLSDKRFEEDIEPLVAPGVPWSIEECGSFVLDKLTARIPGD